MAQRVFPDTAYSNREIDSKFQSFSGKFDEFDKDMRESNTRIEMAVGKTNGSVAELNRWRERVNGGALVAGFFMTLVVVPILAWAIWVLVNINTTITNSVNDALAAYDITKP